jgi:MFS family permease
MNNTTAANAQRLLWAGFFSIFANGVGFAVRGRILVDWGREYGFTQKELGDITGGGLWGFGLMIIAGALFADFIGYGRLMAGAFVLHVLSAVLQMCTGAIAYRFGPPGVYWSLTLAMLMYSFANGLCEVVVNPMVATLFPKQKTHYLNILHAGWPGGLIAGGVISYLLNDVIKVHWIIQMSLFLIPVAIYGVMLAGQRLPRSEAQEAGLPLKTMLMEFLAPVLLLLLVIHAMVGYVELGTDSWIQKITGNIMASAMAGTLLFIYTNILMFTLRFFAGPIERHINPLGLLFGAAVIACCGLLLLSNAVGIILCVLAVSVYGIGKTFFWPTMLAVVSERFPKGGALTLGAVGGVGMLSAGLLGAPGIGFQQDYYATSNLKKEAPATASRYVVDEPKTFLFVFHAYGLESTKVGLLDLAANKYKLTEKLKEADNEREKTSIEAQIKDTAAELNLTLTKLADSHDSEQRAIAVEWKTTLRQYVQVDAEPVVSATLFGSRMALLWTALVPAMMAVLYLFLILYFRVQGGYKRVELTEQAEEKSAAAPWE